MRFRAIVWICGLLGLLAPACGYRFVQGGKLPGAVKRVSVHMFSNRTAESGLEHLLTNALIYEFTRSNMAELVEDGQAEAIISGGIQSLRVDSAARTTLQTTTEMRVTVTGYVKLTGRDGKTLWESQGITVMGTYLITGDPENNKKEKMREVAKRFAEKIFQQMTADF